MSRLDFYCNGTQRCGSALNEVSLTLPHKFIYFNAWIAVSPPGTRAGAIIYRLYRTPAYTGHTVLTVMEPLRLAAFQPYISHRAYPLAQPAAYAVGA